MKYAVLALACSLGASVAAAQAPAAASAPEVAKPKCEPVPEFPGRAGLQLESIRRKFERDMKSYETCMKAYLEARRISIKAHQDAAQTAVEEYNTIVKNINKEREEASR